jgi:hypothetical protein
VHIKILSAHRIDTLSQALHYLAPRLPLPFRDKSRCNCDLARGTGARQFIPRAALAPTRLPWAITLPGLQPSIAGLCTGYAHLHFTRPGGRNRATK